MTYTKSFPIQFDGVAHADAIVAGPQVRFTVLTSRLLRLEFSPTDTFEDRSSQAFWYRRHPVPEFKVEADNDKISIQTEHLQLRYQASEVGFSSDSLKITLAGDNTIWQYDQRDIYNLRGTTRTLDQADGQITLEEGLISRDGWSVYDDTSRLVFTEDGWLTQRNAPTGYQDLYFFGHGADYYGCLREFSRVTGPAPMIPRWALGNWWSRYWAYSEDELLGLMDEFRAKSVPLSVCIVDMDWHITATGNASSGWTGYTWNQELFPDPKRFIDALHTRGLKTALNLHPASGIYPHEVQYPAMAQHMGVDPESQEPIPFSIADPRFTQGYFEILHHPYEADGVDFWWTDWQQGKDSGLTGLDPLWWLNHLHFFDLGREGAQGARAKRPFIFSRWGGLGNHRCPIGFSGDTIVSWDTLQFQPYFTATAANVNYGWWSHDIGGHTGGIEDPELYTRWIQYGVFSPILRMHCTNNPFHERRPWGFDAEVERVTSDALRLRHALIPYLYTMAWRNHSDHVPLIRPMYYDHPNTEPAYHCPQQYSYGSELIAAPVVHPIDPDTRHSRQAVWLPDGEWFNFFDGTRYTGEGWYPIYCRLDEIPVFAKAGAIVPVAPKVGWGGITNPDLIELQLFPGADNQFSLYEDDDHLTCSQTPISSRWTPQSWSVTVGVVEGETGHLPTTRTFVALFRGVVEDAVATATCNGKAVEVDSDYDAQTRTWRITTDSHTPADTLTYTLTAESLQMADTRVLDTCQKLVKAFPMESMAKQSLFNKLPVLVENPATLAHFTLVLNDEQMRAMLDTITGAGYHHSSTRKNKDEEILFWNNAETDNVRYKLVAADLNRQSAIMHEPLPSFGVLTMSEKTLSLHKGNQPAVGRITVVDWFGTLASRIRTELAVETAAVVQFEIGDLQAYLTLDKGVNSLVDGRHDKPDVTISTETAVWLALVNGDSTPEELFLSGKLNVVGDMDLVLSLVDFIQIAPQNKYLANKYWLDVSYLDILTISLHKSEK